jgi:transposase
MKVILAATLLPILKERIVPDSIVYSDSLPSYNALAVAGFRHLRKFNGVSKAHFPLFLKECEWRFNNPNPQTQLKQLNQWVQQSLT